MCGFVSVHAACDGKGNVTVILTIAFCPSVGFQPSCVFSGVIYSAPAVLLRDADHVSAVAPVVIFIAPGRGSRRQNHVLVYPVYRMQCHGDVILYCSIGLHFVSRVSCHHPEPVAPAFLLSTGCKVLHLAGFYRIIINRCLVRVVLITHHFRRCTAAVHTRGIHDEKLPGLCGVSSYLHIPDHIAVCGIQLLLSVFH